MRGAPASYAWWIGFFPPAADDSGERARIPAFFFAGEADPNMGRMNRTTNPKNDLAGGCGFWGSRRQAFVIVSFFEVFMNVVRSSPWKSTSTLLCLIALSGCIQTPPGAVQAPGVSEALSQADASEPAAIVCEKGDGLCRLEVSEGATREQVLAALDTFFRDQYVLDEKGRRELLAAFQDNGGDTPAFEKALVAIGPELIADPKAARRAAKEIAEQHGAALALALRAQGTPEEIVDGVLRGFELAGAGDVAGMAAQIEALYGTLRERNELTEEQFNALVETTTRLMTAPVEECDALRRIFFAGGGRSTSSIFVSDSLTASGYIGGAETSGLAFIWRIFIGFALTSARPCLPAEPEFPSSCNHTDSPFAVPTFDFRSPPVALHTEMRDDNQIQSSSDTQLCGRRMAEAYSGSPSSESPIHHWETARLQGRFSISPGDAGRDTQVLVKVDWASRTSVHALGNAYAYAFSKILLRVWPDDRRVAADECASPDEITRDVTPAPTLLLCNVGRRSEVIFVDSETYLDNDARRHGSSEELSCVIPAAQLPAGGYRFEVLSEATGVTSMGSAFARSRIEVTDAALYHCTR